MSDITAFACVIIRNTASVDRYENLGLYSHILTQDVNPVYVCWRQVSHVLTSVLSSVQGTLAAKMFGLTRHFTK